VPTADNKIQFHADGGTIIGVGNGDPACLEADHGDERSLFNGLAQVIVQAPRQAGTITLTAQSPGLMGASVTLNVDGSGPRPSVP
jgi:beta-galactosidase